MAQPGFWDDQAKVTSLGRERTSHKNILDKWQSLHDEIADCLTAYELLEEEADSELEEEIEGQILSIEREIGGMEFRKMLSGDNDEANAIIAINPGAGGTEAQDWAEMLMRMYMRWCEQRGFEAEVMDRLPGDEAGIKSVTIAVKGDYAFGYLKAEQGVHRLVRISPYDSQARRHTSFASVSVYPEADEKEALEIDEKDLKIDVFRASGAGGQHVNKTESAVRITHLPTKIVVGCQSERSQHKNKANAMRILRARILEMERLQREAEKAQKEAEKMEIAWGSQIRSYVLQPYRKVKDHRTGIEEGNVDKVLDGGIDGFIEGFLLQSVNKN